MPDPGVRRLLGVAAALGVLAVLLVITEFVTDSSRSGAVVNRSAIASVDSLVDHFLRDQGIDRKKERKWSVRGMDGTVIRIERRIQAPREKISLELNRSLNEAASNLGGHVAGTERTKESTVILHIVVGGMTVHTLTLEPEKPQSP